MTFQPENWLWCTLQATVLACVGAAVMAALRRRPASSAIVGSAAAASILAVTALAPVKLPSLAGESVARVNPVTPAVAKVQSASAGATRSAAPLTENSVDLGAMARFLSRTVKVAAEARPQASGVSPATLMRVALAGALIGLVRLGFSLACVARLRSGWKRVEDADVTSLVAELAQRLEVRRPIIVCETAATISPAVIGWRRPVVLLPAGWRDWREENLRVALAHELAHVKRGDFSWRLAASVVRAIHFLNPLVHWFAQRLTLAQELAADRLAAAAVGGTAGYTRALADLALAFDGGRRSRSDSIMLPIFSSNLTRRMTMLRSTDGSEGGAVRSLVGWAAAATIVLMAIGSTAVKSLAEDPAAKSAATAERSPFSINAPDVSYFGPVDAALLVVQADDIAKLPNFAWLAAVAETFVQDELNSLKLKDAMPPHVDLKSIDYIAYAMRRMTPTEIAKNPGLVPGSPDGAMICEVAIRWVQPTDAQAWLAEHMPDAEAVVEDGVKCVRLKIGDEKSATAYVAQRDANTVVGTYSIDRLRTLLAQNSEPSKSVRERWQRVGGGLATLCVNPAGIPEGANEALRGTPLSFFGATATPGQPDVSGLVNRAISENAQEICIGVDLARGAKWVGLRTAFACADATAAGKVRESTSFYQALAKGLFDAYTTQILATAEAQESLDAGSRAYVDGLMLGLQLVAQAKCEVRSEGDGGAELWIENEGELPKSVLSLTNCGVIDEPASDASEAEATTSAAAVSAEPATPLFSRAPIAPAIPSAAKGGQFLIRVGELSQRQEMAIMFQSLKTTVRDHWRTAFDADAPDLNLSSIEYIAGLSTLTIDGTVRPQTPNSTGSLMLGCGGVVVRFKEDVDWQGWFRKYIPAAQEKTDEGLVYLQLYLPAAGPAPLEIAARDSRTLVMAEGHSYLRKLIAAAESEAPAGVLSGWDSLAGGLAAGVFSDASIDHATKVPKAPEAEVVLQNTRGFGIAFDLAPTSDTAAIRLDLTCADAAAAEKVDQAIHALLPQGAAELEKELATRTEEEKATNAVWLEAIKSCGTEILKGDDGTMRVRVSATAKFPAYLVPAEKVAEKTDAEEATR